MKSSKIIKILIAVAMILFIVNKFLTVKGTKNIYESHRSGYLLCQYVDGIQFDVPGSIRGVQMENEMFHADSDYLSGAWVISTGDSYMAFKYNYMVILAVRGTSFLKYEDSEEAFRKVPVMSTWLTHDKKYFEKDGMINGAYKRIASVVADVSINPEFYGTYSGRWAAITRDDEEWSLFIGYKAGSYEDLSSEQKDIIGHVCASLACTESYEKTSEDTDDTRETPLGITPETALEVQPEPAMEEETAPEPTATISPTSVPEPTETVSTSPTPKPTPTPEPVSFPEPAADTGKESSVKTPLKIGERGRCYERYAEGSLEIGVTPETLYTRNGAKELLDELAVMEDAPEGTRWQVLKFSSTADPEICQIYCEILGTDGNDLIYNGVINPKRTHVVSGKAAKTDDTFAGYYVYYPVPNGCKEYLLAFGSPEAGDRAYFLIINRRTLVTLVVS